MRFCLSKRICGRSKKKGKVRNDTIRQIKAPERARKKEDTVVGTLRRVSDDRGSWGSWRLGALSILRQRTKQLRGWGVDHEPARR